MRPERNNRRNQLNIRLSDEELARIDAAAKRARRTPVDWARLRLLAAAPCASEQKKAVTE